MNLTEKRGFENSIQTKLIGVMILVIAFELGMNFFIFGQITAAVKRIDAVFSSNVTINTLSATLLEVQDTVYEYLNTKSSQALEDYYRYEQDYRTLIEELNDRNVDSEIKMLEKNIRRMSESFLEQTDQTVQAKRGRNIEKYRESYEKETRLFDYINSYIYTLNNLKFRQNSSNYQTLLQAMDILEEASMVIMVIGFCLAAIATIFLVRDMIRPLMALSATAHEVARGNLEVPQLPVVYDDEIGIVTNGFNQMLGSIRDYIDKLKDSMEKEALMKEQELLMETHLKEAQLKFLQAQINPHFLFNSLNAGMQLAILEDAEKTTVFLERMADFFRYNVRKVGNDTTLMEEIELVDTYIYILNVRFAGDIKYQKNVDRDVGNVRVPSMILQPLVENAVQHGIHDCLEDGWIHLEVHRENSWLRISVSDNGEGMSHEKIEAIMEGRTAAGEDSENRTGIALDNVFHRLQLYYNRDNLLRVESEGEGMGTVVTILLPLDCNV
jgi:sensor histidine kinase YesM